MVFLNRIFYSKSKSGELPLDAAAYHTQVDDILTFINQNIDSQLSIDDLSSHFYLSSSICAVFSKLPQALPSTNILPPNVLRWPNPCSAPVIPSRKRARGAALTITAIFLRPLRRLWGFHPKSMLSVRPADGLIECSACGSEVPFEPSAGRGCRVLLFHLPELRVLSRHCGWWRGGELWL